MKRTALGCILIFCVCFGLPSCGYKSNNSNKGPTTSGVTPRAFISSSTGTTAGLIIIDATLDRVARKHAVFSAGIQPSLMFRSIDKKVTLVTSPLNLQVQIISNAQEAATASFPIADQTESIMISADNGRAYVAEPNASIFGQAPGIVQVFDIKTTPVQIATIPIPRVHTLIESPNGNRILAFSDNSDVVTMISTSNVGTNTNPLTPIADPLGLLSRPVAGFMNADNTTAWVISCGAECGGTNASVSKIDLGTAMVLPQNVSVVAATTGVISGNTMYVAGTSPTLPCTLSHCGQLSTVDLTSLTVTKTVEITDGFHDRVGVGSNNRVFAGAIGCTNTPPSAPPPQRGCLAIYNTQSDAVIIAPENGDVTGILPIVGRNVVYVIVGNQFKIYDTTTDTILVQTNPLDIVGLAIDVMSPDQ